MDHHHDWAAGPATIFPYFGGLMFLLFLLLVGTAFFLARRGQFGPPPWASRPPAPEREARSILAERFARGEISSDEFMERASVLNWTPGSEPVPAAPRSKKRR